MTDDNERTTIIISKETKKKFDQLGSVGMTQDSVLNSLIDFYNRYKGAIDRR